MIALIGPPGAGKSTVAVHLADVLGCEAVDADGVCGPLYAEVGWSVARFAQLSSERGYERAHREWETALAHAVERLVELHPDAVVAFGAGHTHLTRPPLFERIRVALRQVDAVVLLRPDPDLSTAVEVLRRRCLESKGRDWIRDGVDWLERWCTDGRDEQLATVVVHNGDEAPEHTAARTARLVGVDLRPAPRARSADRRERR